jgi:hypothetical protein
VRRGTFIKSRIGKCLKIYLPSLYSTLIDHASGTVVRAVRLGWVDVPIKELRVKSRAWWN